MTVSCLLFVGLSALFSPPRLVLIPHSVFLPMSQFMQQDLIIRGGQNVYPAEVEYFLHTHPKIQDAQVKRIIEAGVRKAYCKISWFKSAASRSIICRVCFLMNTVMDCRRSAIFTPEQLQEGEKRCFTFTHEQNIICSQALRISSRLFIGSYMQVTWWALDQWNGRKTNK